MAVRERSSSLKTWAGFLVAIGAPVLLTVALDLAGGPKLRDYAFLYLGVVGVLGVGFGLWPSLISAIASFLLVDYFLVPPYHTLSIASEQDVVNLVVLLGAAGLVGTLGSMRRRAQLRSDALARELRVANRELERLMRDQSEASQVALRLAITEQQVKALEESDRARREFLANVSHDLRTPIATILTETTGVIGDPMSPRTKSSLEAIIGEARRLNAIVTDMLDMARIEGNALDLQPEAIDLDLAIRSAAERLQRGSPERVVAVTPAAHATFVVADWTRLGQVLDNLLSNSNRAAPPRSPIAVQVSVIKDKGTATVRVRDEGPGIPRELGDRVFERFVRGGGGGGTGLGLAIVKGLVEAQGGRVWIDAGTPGASIAFSMPLADVAGEGD